MTLGKPLTRQSAIELDAVPPHFMARLDALLKERGMTKTALQVGLAPRLRGRWLTNVYAITRGVQRPRREWIEVVADYLSVRPVDVVGPWPGEES